MSKKFSNIFRQNSSFSIDDMEAFLKEKGKSKSFFKKGQKIEVYDKFQKNYHYSLTEPMGKNFHDDFKPHLTPKEMLKLGVFEGKYLNDCLAEYPKDWFLDSINNLSPEGPDVSKNYFKIKSRLSLKEWKKRGWIPIAFKDNDPRGWFQWYCRYYIGRRDPNVDNVQIKRWKSFKRHLAQVEKNCRIDDLNCRPKQRQALLQWAYDPFI